MAPVQVARRHREADVGEALQQRREGDVALETSEWRAEAEVDAVAEREVAVVAPLDVERLRVPEALSCRGSRRRAR